MDSKLVKPIKETTDKPPFPCCLWANKYNIKTTPKKDPKGKNNIIPTSNFKTEIIRKNSENKFKVGGADILAAHNIKTIKLAIGIIFSIPLLINKLRLPVRL